MRPALLLFVVALLMRCLFWVATPDREWTHAVACQGDAALWQQLAREQATPLPPGAQADLQLRLPLRPPAMHWLVSSLWNGDAATAWRMRLLFVLLAALHAPLLYLALRREFAPRIACIAGAGAAVATNLMLIGSGLHVETPYLLVVLLTFLDWPEVRRGAHPLVAVRWGLLHGVATLLRAEHPLLLLLLLLLQWRQGRRLLPLRWPLLGFAIAVLPWQVQAMRLVHRFNDVPRPELPAARTLPWEPAALDAVRALPAFQQLPVWQFVDDTVRCRGGTRVQRSDLQVVVEAYGCWPEPLHQAFVALYGPLNFFLANSPESDGGFTNAPLQRRPPLLGGPERYPPGLLQVLPLQGQLTPDYPPHLQALNHGYGLGWEWIAAHPAAALRLVLHKLQFFWQGAASGIGGYGLPMGLSGPRRRVDLVTAEGAIAAGWRLLVLLAAGIGLWRGRRHAALPGWLLPLLTGVVANVLFFGYARLGALSLPSLLLLLALAADGVVARLPARTARRVGTGLLIAVLATEALRALSIGAPRLDGRDIGTGQPFAEDGYAERRVQY